MNQAESDQFESNVSNVEAAMDLASQHLTGLVETDRTIPVLMMLSQHEYARVLSTYSHAILVHGVHPDAAIRNAIEMSIQAVFLAGYELGRANVSLLEADVADEYKKQKEA
jgi:hypothetical protein